ncbi:hypothetical protein PInf_001361 [Phytophthora infestans]|nr:hypothetical protein PInf_001361 [Phytophthora infestans]
MATPRTLTLTTDVVMNRAGVYDLLALKELILRDEELTEVDETCAQSLASLEILSLSHNRLTSLDNFQYFVNLIELNVNFNQIERLDSLQCSGLEKLFIANNQVVDISPLRKLLKLNTLSVYGNRITDLDSALHTCRSLPRLRSLDLGGNPCSHDVEGYKFRVVRALSRLKKLDGDHITQLDKDLTEEFFATMHKNTRPSINGFIGARPFTAPAAGVRGRLTASLSETTISNGIDPFASSLMPRGNVRLFRDDFLNNNPILLEYLSQDAGSAPVNEGNTTLSSDGENSLPATSGFVDKMRSANPLPKNDTETSDADSTSTDGQKKISLSPNVSTSHLGVDPSDPNTTIRKLLKHIEVLMETLDKYKNHQLNAVSESLLEGNKQLQTENNNIPILQEEIQDLKKRLARAEGDPGGAKVQETKRVKSLELLDESALVDVELTELILQNEVSLELIRNDIKNTKKEWEEQFQRAKAAESERVRPQTSMGFTSSSNRPRESLDSSVTVAQNGGTHTLATRDRRLHTSAGFRHGPEAHLLGQMPVHPLTSIREASRDGSSTTNILTL